MIECDFHLIFHCLETSMNNSKQLNKITTKETNTAAVEEFYLVGQNAV
jgi:hypothetical protein